jgi:hypothetical protein
VLSVAGSGGWAERKVEKLGDQEAHQISPGRVGSGILLIDYCLDRVTQFHHSPIPDAESHATGSSLLKRPDPNHTHIENYFQKKGKQNNIMD